MLRFDKFTSYSILINTFFFSMAVKRCDECTGCFPSYIFSSRFQISRLCAIKPRTEENWRSRTVSLLMPTIRLLTNSEVFPISSIWHVCKKSLHVKYHWIHKCVKKIISIRRKIVSAVSASNSGESQMKMFSIMNELAPLQPVTASWPKPSFWSHAIFPVSSPCAVTVVFYP